LWERLANAAGSLSVDVGKAWAATITAHSGEVTPPDHESSLTRAMKAYHLAKARSPTDLPEWLFDNNERHSNFSLVNEESEIGGRSLSTTRARGLRDIYDAAAASSRNVEPKADTTRNRFFNEHGMESKAADRLNALRDARRHRGRSDGHHPVQSDTGMSNRAGRATNTDYPRLEARQGSKFGLPTRPGRF